jgi:hypothetical protein
MKPVTLKSPEPFGTAKKLAVEGILATCVLPVGPLGPLGPVVVAARAAANATGNTAAVGIAGDAAAVIGINAGSGIYFGPAGEMGLYASVGGDIGATLGASVGVGITMVKGGPDNLAGDCVSVSAAGGEVVVGSLSVLFTMDGKFSGICGVIGVGVGWPIDFYASYSHTWITPPTKP